jgi:hypothetical protein
VPGWGREYVASGEGGGEEGEDLRLVGAGRLAADVDPVGVMTVFVEVQIHGMRVVVHGGVLAGVHGRPVHAETVGDGAG